MPLRTLQCYNAAEFKKHIEDMLSPEDGWKEVDVTVCCAVLHNECSICTATHTQVGPQHVPGMPCTLRATFYYKDLLRVLVDEFRNPEYQGHFVLRAEEKRDATGPAQV